jgi:hypothetical protein
VRWRKRYKPAPSFGDTRVVREFLFLPLTLEGETRWLELASIQQEYVEGNFYMDGEHWMSVGWDVATPEAPR